MNGRTKMIMAAAGLLALTALRAGAQTGAFKFFGPLARVLSPNGDGRNDLAFFCYDNPADGDVSGKIYTVLGSEVASTGPRGSSTGTACAGGFLPQFSTWDGRSGGTAVRNGVYIYRITAEGRVFTGTLLVVR